MKPYLASALLFIFPCLSFCADGTGSDLKIRILISGKSPQAALNTYGDVIISDASGRRFKLVPNATYIIKSDSENFLYLSKEKLSSPVDFFIPDGKNFLKVNGKKYKGNLRAISHRDGVLNIVEEISFEKYLLGVLAPEMGPDWPIEALKAQAVASRTYAARLLSRGGDYDIGNDTSHQVYTGLEKVNPSIIEAVSSTRGEVLYYNGRLITAFFHACCGGKTTSPSAAFQGDIIKPLKGVSDPYCKISNHYEWDITVSESDLLRLIQENGSTALKLKGIRIYSKDRSGRAVKLDFQTDRGSFKMETRDIRKALGYFEFKSTFITRIEKTKKGYTFYGKGWGHGVGMCQEGAKVMAKKGFSYKKILTYYYPGARITDIEKFFSK